MTTFDGLPHSLRQPHASHHLVLHDHSPGFPTSRRDHGCRFSHPSVNETDEKTEAIKAHFRRSPGVKKTPGHYRSSSSARKEVGCNPRLWQERTGQFPSPATTGAELGVGEEYGWQYSAGVIIPANSTARTFTYVLSS